MAAEAGAEGDAVAEVSRVFTEHRPQSMAGLVRALGDFGVAEDPLADALEIAMKRWPTSGAPDDPVAWAMFTNGYVRGPRDTEGGLVTL